MSLRSWLQKEVADPRGAWTRLDGVRARPNRAFFARNVRFEPGRVKTRSGFIAGVIVAGKVISTYDWINAGFGYVLIFEDGTVKAINKANEAVTSMFPQAGRGMVVAEAGDEAYIAVYGSNGLGAGQVRISQPNIGIGTTDTAFAAPFVEVPVITDTGAGEVTQGVHKFAYIVQTRTGFAGQPGPKPGDVFSPVSFNVAAGGRALNMAITVTIPANASFVYPIMTRADNPDRWYFVPDVQVPLTPGPTTLNIPINISDERLADGAEEANENFDAIVATVANAGPFSPSFVFNYGQRMAYIVDDKVYFSDQDDFQFITEDRNVVQVPGKKRMVAGGQLRQSAYLLGYQFTYEVADNGDFPSTWAPPSEVSSSIGAVGPEAIETHTAGDYWWVVSRSGVYLFDGRYATRPISYYQSTDWNRINWAAADRIKIRDLFTRQELYVAVPLDGATEPTHTMCWSYARGLTPEEVDYSLDDYNTGTSFGRFGGLGIVRNPTTLLEELWITPVAAAAIRKQSASATDDAGATITSEWESGFVLGGDGRKKINRFGGIDVSVSGGGFLSVIIYGPDRLRNTSFSITMSNTPGEDPEVKFDMTEEDISVRFRSELFAQTFDLSSFVVYHKPYATNR